MLSSTLYAHPGRTDSSGGHNNYISGGYHYHHSRSMTFWESLREGLLFLLILSGLMIIAHCGYPIYQYMKNALIKIMSHWITWTIIFWTIWIGGLWLICSILDWIGIKP